MSDQTPRLSEAAHQRRESMRGELLGELGRVRAKRQLQRRVGGSAAMVALAASLIWIAWRPNSPNLNQLANSTPSPRIEIVRTDLALTASWIVRTDGSALASATRLMEPEIEIERLSDRELITRLAALGTPAGIARAGERVWLTEDVFARR